MRSLLVTLGVALGFAGAARADPIDTSLCNQTPPSLAASYGLAKVTAGPKVFLRNCPPGATADCREPAKRPYVISGDLVIVGAHAGGVVCALMPNRLGGSAGWVGASEITPLPSVIPPRADWRGHWTEVGGDEIDIAVRGDVLKVTGSACWPSCNVSLRERPGGPNVGDLDDQARPGGNVLSLGAAGDDTDCKVLMWLVGRYLLVFDNRNCGGMNVTFTGVYQKRAGR